MNSIIAFYIFIIGLCIGSFLNVVILRGLSGENFIISRSKCPKCNNQLKWYMNIPLISYIFLKGKCAFCGEKISVQYPIVEFITGCTFLILYLTFGFTFKTLFMCLFFSLFIAISTTDILETVIIDYHAYILAVLAVIYALFGLNDINTMQAVIGGVLGYIIFEILARIGYFISNFRMFGEGDSLIALGLGAIFGIKNFLITIILSILIQSLCAIPVLIINTYKKRDYRLSVSYILVLFSLFFVFIVNYFEIIKNSMIYLGIVILITMALLWSVKNILSSVKNKKELDFNEAKTHFSLLPFGPAMIISAVVCIFFLKQIKLFIHAFLF
ncbi:MAG: prepilin peptidase [Candidatus Gastranaerophilales bacterium]|nr:prepilin peptidase [Candidatus Gastranaerophilales bacterium]